MTEHNDGDIECDPAEWPAWTDEAVWHATEDVRPVTARQGEVYATILELTRDRGMPPTTREVAEAIGSVSPNAAMGHLGYLRDKGWLLAAHNRSRAIRPRFGRVAAREVSSWA